MTGMKGVRRISAHIVFPVSSEPVYQGIVTIEPDGTIVSVDKWTPGKEDYNTEFYNGILVPGFVNAHCHLELSYMKGSIEEGGGLAAFIAGMRARRERGMERAADSAAQYDTRMHRSGVSAVADIVNSDITQTVKRNSQIRYRNLIEVFGLRLSDAGLIMQKAQDLKKVFSDANITPHALYSLSDELFNALSGEMAYETLGSIHYLESADENQYYQTGGGDFAEELKKMTNDLPVFVRNGKAAMLSMLWGKNNRVLLVHNTFADEEDEAMIKSTLPEAYRVLCPESNRYISKKCPSVEAFRKDRICLGTDSLASNHDLNMVAEMRCLSECNPELLFADVLQMATLNGANALSVASDYGSIEPGKKPGLVLIENFDFSHMRLSDQSISRRLV